MDISEDIRQIGRYQILRSLGQGAMARVYLAELSTLGDFRRKVALKVVRSEFARDPKFAQLMAREAMIGSRLQHPNIVETLEFNEVDGRMFLALEFVEGQTVEDLLAQTAASGQKGLPVDLAMEIIIQVLKGLSYAHNLTSAEGEVMGIIHRDLKPGNIMVSRHGSVKVMDFGIAKAKIAAATITAAGQVRGTPIYMAPEQVTGKPLDGRCDQFAAATVLYELITGEQLFIARNLIDIMRRVARADVGDAVRRMDRVLPGLGLVVQRMWSLSSEDRYQDCQECARDLEDLLPAARASASMTRTPVETVAEAPAQAVPPPPPRPAPPVVEEPRRERRAEPRPLPDEEDEGEEEEETKKASSGGGWFGLFRRRARKPEEPKKKRRRDGQAASSGGISTGGDRRKPGESGGIPTSGDRRRPADGEAGGEPGQRRRRRRKRRTQPGGAVPEPVEAAVPAPPQVEPEPDPDEPARVPNLAEMMRAQGQDEPPTDRGGKLRAEPSLAEVSRGGQPPGPPPEVDASDSAAIVLEDTTFGDSSKGGIETVSEGAGQPGPDPMDAPSSPLLRGLGTLSEVSRPDQLAAHRSPEQPAGSTQVTWTDRPTAGLRKEKDDEDDEDAPMDSFFFED